jgi:predicted NBD/HSP70 family sugar kinase
MYVLAFDIGGTSVKYGVLHRDGEIFEKGEFTTPQNDIDKLMAGIVEIKVKFEKKYEFEGIAMSCPGAVDDKTGFIAGTSAVPCIHGFNFRERLRKDTGIENIRMDNDGNCAGLAEVWKGAAKDYNDVLFVIFGSGVGGAIIKDKKIHKGAHLKGGEFGYMIISQECEVLSNVASPVNMAKMVAKRKGIQSLTGKEAFKLAEQGDIIAIEEVERFYYNVAIGIYNIQYIFDPEVIVIGGGISSRPDILENIERLMDKVLTKVQITGVEKTRPIIRKCKFRNDANLIGAVYNYISS